MKTKTKTKTNETQLTSKQRVMLAVVLGGTNLGMSLPTSREAATMRGLDVHQDAYALWSRYAESDEMMDGFLEECRWWYADRKNLNSRKMTVEYVRRVWPDAAALCGLS